MLKELLDQAGLTQSSFARRLGITPKAVNRWINGHQETPRWALEYAKLYAGIKELLK